MKRTYHKPPMKFNPGWKTFEVDLPKKKLPKEKFSSEKQVRNVMLFVILIIVMAIAFAVIGAIRNG